MNVTRDDIFAVVPEGRAIVESAGDGSLSAGVVIQLSAPQGCFQLQIAKMCAEAAGCSRPLVLGVADLSVRTDLLAEMLRSPSILGESKAVIFADVDKEQELFCSLLPYLEDSLTFLLVEDRFLPQAVTVEFNWLPRKAFIKAMKEVFALDTTRVKFAYDSGVGEILYYASSGCPELALALIQKCSRAKRKSEFIMQVNDTVSTIKKATTQLYADLVDRDLALETVGKRVRVFVESVAWRAATGYLLREIATDALANPEMAVMVGVDKMVLEANIISEAHFSMFCIQYADKVRKVYANATVPGTD